MQFSFGWQLVAVFGGLILLAVGRIPITDALFLFGRAMENNESMPARPVYFLALIGLAGVVTSLFL